MKEGASEIAARAGGGSRRLRECMLGLVWAVPGSNFREHGPSVAKICPIEYSPFVRNGASAEGASKIAARAGGRSHRLRECMLGLVWAIPGSNFRENGPSVAKICPIEYSPFVRNGASAEGASKIAARAGGGSRCLRECMFGLVWAVPGSNFRENGPSVGKICPIEYSPFVWQWC